MIETMTLFTVKLSVWFTTKEPRLAQFSVNFPFVIVDFNIDE